MWFAFPDGYERIAVERQEFVPEVTDDAGRKYFRAPNHFAPSILAFKGFTVVEVPPEGAPDDLPQADPLRDSAISLLTSEKASLERDVANMRTDLAAANARIVALVNENTSLKATVDELEAKIESLEEDEELKTLDVPPAKPVVKK